MPHPKWPLALYLIAVFYHTQHWMERIQILLRTHTPIEWSKTLRFWNDLLSTTTTFWTLFFGNAWENIQKLQTAWSNVIAELNVYPFWNGLLFNYSQNWEKSRLWLFLSSPTTIADWEPSGNTGKKIQIFARLSFVLKINFQPLYVFCAFIFLFNFCFYFYTNDIVQRASVEIGSSLVSNGVRRAACQTFSQHSLLLTFLLTAIDNTRITP